VDLRPGPIEGGKLKDQTKEKRRQQSPTSKPKSGGTSHPTEVGSAKGGGGVPDASREKRTGRKGETSCDGSTKAFFAKTLLALRQEACLQKKKTITTFTEGGERTPDPKEAVERGLFVRSTRAVRQCRKGKGRKFLVLRADPRE